MPKSKEDTESLSNLDSDRLKHPNVSGWCGPRHKSDAQRRLERLINDRERLLTEAEVLQENLRCYIASKRLESIQPAFDSILKIVDEVIAIDPAAVEKAK